MQEIFIITVSSILLIIDMIVYQKNRKFLKCKIDSQNKILFYKLKKEYLNNIKQEDYMQLICFLYKDFKERNNKNGKKR